MGSTCSKRGRRRSTEPRGETTQTEPERILQLRDHCYCTLLYSVPPQQPLSAAAAAAANCSPLCQPWNLTYRCQREFSRNGTRSECSYPTEKRAFPAASSPNDQHPHDKPDDPVTHGIPYCKLPMYRTHLNITTDNSLSMTDAA